MTLFQEYRNSNFPKSEVLMSCMVVSIIAHLVAYLISDCADNGHAINSPRYYWNRFSGCYSDRKQDWVEQCGIGVSATQ